MEFRVVLPVFALLACSPKANGTTASTEASSSSGADADSESGSAESEASTGTDEGVATTGMTDTTSSADATSGGDGDGDSSTGDGDGECMPPGSGWSCNVASDCAIAGDCCTCTAYNPSMGTPGSCGGGCGQSKCDDWGVTAAACIAGECVAVGASCNQDTVLCDGIPPDCAPDELPGVAAGCWSGSCIPAVDCDWVPDCSYCGPEQTCMLDRRGGCEFQRCVDPFPECGPGDPVCNCLGGIWCEGAACTATEAGFTCG